MRLGRYGQMLNLPGIRRIFMWSVVGRLAASMIGLGLVLRTVQSGGSYALAGTVTAAFALLAGLTAPILARLVDHHGQSSILLPTAVATFAACALFSALARDAPSLELIGIAALIGIAWPPFGGSTSALLRSLSIDEPTRQSAFALDASLSEACSIAGPLLVVLIAGIASASAAVLVAGSLICSGTLGLAASKPSRAARGLARIASARRNPFAALSPGVGVLVGTMLLMFVGFAATEVAVVAAARDVSGTGAAGVLLAVWSVGSVVGGVIYGARAWPGILAIRIAVTLAATAALTALMIPLHDPVMLAVFLFVSGVSCGPGISMIYAALSDVATSGTVTEAFAWLASSTTLGSAIGATVGGAMITQHGVADALAVASIGTALGGALVVCGRSAIAQPEAEDALPVQVQV